MTARIGPKVHVLFRKEDLDGMRLAGKVVVVLDILFATSTITLVERLLAHPKDAHVKAELGRRSSWLAREAAKFIAGTLPKARLELHLLAAKGDAGAKAALQAAVGAERTKAKAAKAKAKTPAQAPAQVPAQVPAMPAEMMAAWTAFVADWQTKQAPKASKAPKAPARKGRAKSAAAK